MTTKMCCEYVVWYVLPLIRKEFAISLIEDHKLSQRKSAELLGITESAVSQYISKKRGAHEKFNATLKEEIQKSTKRILKGNITVMKKETCRICHLLQPEEIDIEKFDEEACDILKKNSMYKKVPKKNKKK